MSKSEASFTGTTVGGILAIWSVAFLIHIAPDPAKEIYWWGWWFPYMVTLIIINGIGITILSGFIATRIWYHCNE